LVVVIVAGVCVRLGFWQLDRLSQRRALNASIEAGLSEDPAPLKDVLDASPDPDALGYRRVTATGSYDATGELLLYGRALDGRPGDHVLTPLVLGDGSSVLVDRGWVPSEPNRTVPVGPPAAAPSGAVTVEGVLLPAEPGAAFASDDSASATLIRAVNVSEIDARMTDHELAPAYLLLQTQTPPQTEGLPAPAPMPEPSEGPHLSYAFQWFSFASIALVGYVVVIRRDRRQDRGDITEEG
jgi:surfeit locus 1 family protein